MFGRATGLRLKELLKPGMSLRRRLPKGARRSSRSAASITSATPGFAPDAESRRHAEDDAAPLRRVPRYQRCCAEGVEHIKQVYTGFRTLSIQDRSLIWNTDLVETLGSTI